MASIVPWPSPLFGYPDGAHGRNGQSIKGICFHTMDGYWSYYQQIIAGKVTIRNSANYSLNRDGTIHQHVQDADAAWCNGPMDRPDLTVPWIKACVEGKVNPNLVTISIECEGRSGEAWPDEQVASLVWWTKEMMRRHPQITPDRLHLVGHHQIYYPKSCPGPSFPWADLMAAVQPPPAPEIPADVVAYLAAHPELGTARVGSNLTYRDGALDWVVKCTTGAVLFRRNYTGAIGVIDWKPPEVVERIIYPDADAVRAIASRIRMQAEELESLPGVKG